MTPFTPALPDISNWRRLLRPALDDREGGVYSDPSGGIYYVKWYERDYEIWTELAAAACYHVADIPYTEPFAALLRNRLVMVSPWLHGATSLHYDDVTGEEPALVDGLFLDIALGNSDVWSPVPQPLLPPRNYSPAAHLPLVKLLQKVRDDETLEDLSGDGWLVNIVRDSQGNLVRLDSGGALRNCDPASRHFDGALEPLSRGNGIAHFAWGFASLPADSYAAASRVFRKLHLGKLIREMYKVGVPMGLARHYARLICGRAYELLAYFQSESFAQHLSGAEQAA